MVRRAVLRGGIFFVECFEKGKEKSICIFVVAIKVTFYG
jgi:hypothetical protein